MAYGNCRMDDCYRKAASRGLCRPHANEAKLNGTYEQVAYSDPRRGPRRSIFEPSQDEHRKRHRLATYGMTHDDYLARMEAQGSCCAICDDYMEMPVVDHCHTLGHVRGLLCTSCNSGLGFFRDRPKALRKAARYLIANQYPPS